MSLEILVFCIISLWDQEVISMEGSLECINKMEKKQNNSTLSIQHNMIKFVSDIVVGRWFSAATPVSSSNKTDHDITEILLKVALKTKNPNPPNIKIVERG